MFFFAAFLNLLPILDRSGRSVGGGEGGGGGDVDEGHFIFETHKSRQIVPRNRDFYVFLFRRVPLTQLPISDRSGRPAGRPGRSCSDGGKSAPPFTAIDGPPGGSASLHSPSGAS